MDTRAGDLKDDRVEPAVGVGFEDGLTEGARAAVVGIGHGQRCRRGAQWTQDNPEESDKKSPKPLFHSRERSPVLFRHKCCAN